MNDPFIDAVIGYHQVFGLALAGRRMLESAWWRDLTWATTPGPRGEYRHGKVWVNENAIAGEMEAA